MNPEELALARIKALRALLSSGREKVAKASGDGLKAVCKEVVETAKSIRQQAEMIRPFDVNTGALNMELFSAKRELLQEARETLNEAMDRLVVAFVVASE